jgi:UDP-N-acetylglucosamine--N-acetylmuramyl-(pentapeptide) pyrophosphoryl-undecaprenol N-acetylglucosamine transferase
MKLAAAGGGTGGHIYPALEVLRSAEEAGWDVRHYGSLRGPEGEIMREAGIAFQGFASEPVFSLRTIRGMRSLWRLQQAIGEAKKSLKSDRPDVLFSTGGYGAAPAAFAAVKLGIPVVIHEQNSVPSRTNLLLAPRAAAVCTTFLSSETSFGNANVIRTGLPVRKEIRSVTHSLPETPTILVVGGSQGSRALNQMVLRASALMAETDVRWLHASGKKLYDESLELKAELGLGNRHDLRPYFKGKEMADAYAQSTLVCARSGGTLAEIAAVRRPSVLIPLPIAFADHQRVNAEEFVSMAAADRLLEADLTPEKLADALKGWIDSPDRTAKAQASLAEWDILDTVPQILKILEQAAA